MERKYRCVLVVLMVGLIVWGIWYVFSCYNDQRSKEGGTLVRLESEVTYGTGNSIY